MHVGLPHSPVPADTRVHLNDDHVPIVGVDRHLDVGASALDAHLADDGDSGVTQALVLLVGQRLGRGHGDRVTCQGRGREVRDKDAERAGRGAKGGKSLMIKIN